MFTDLRLWPSPTFKIQMEKKGCFPALPFPLADFVTFPSIDWHNSHRCVPVWNARDQSGTPGSTPCWWRRRWRGSWRQWCCSAPPSRCLTLWLHFQCWGNDPNFCKWWKPVWLTLQKKKKAHHHATEVYRKTATFTLMTISISKLRGIFRLWIRRKTTRHQWSSRKSQRAALWCFVLMF